MKILFIGKRFYTNRDAVQEQYGRIYQLPSFWAKAGMQTSLWLIDYHSKDVVNRTEGQLRLKSTPIFSRASLSEWHEIRRSSKQVQFDIVVASGDCYIGLMAYRLARRIGAKFVFDVYDKYDEFRAYRNLPGFNLFKHLLDRADGRIFASRPLMAQLQRATHNHLTLNGIDEALFTPSDMSASREALGLPTTGILVGYFGSMTADRGVTDLIASAKILRDKGHPVELILAGRKEHALDTSIEGVTYLGNLPVSQVPLAMSSCDLLALPYRSSPYLDMASSCKITEYIAMRKPVVATLTPNFSGNFPLQARQLDGLLASPGDPASIAEVILKQLESATLLQMPEGATWQEISADTLEFLATLPPPRGT